MEYRLSINGAVVPHRSGLDHKLAGQIAFQHVGRHCNVFLPTAARASSMSTSNNAPAQVVPLTGGYRRQEIGGIGRVRSTSLR